MVTSFHAAIVFVIVLLSGSVWATPTAPKQVTIHNNDPLVYYHGRWDASPGTWWAGSGFKLNVLSLESLNMTLGNHTTSPLASIGVSVNYGAFYQVNVSAGANSIPLSGLNGSAGKNTVVRINVQDWQDNRINLETLTLNSGASLIPYTPSKLAFQYIGDSLSAGQFLPQGVDQAWPFLTGEAYKAEHVVVAQPGAALSDIYSYGNEHGMSYMFFRTEDDGYFYTTDHNYTTPWNFARDVPAATHVVIVIGANDSGQNVTSDSFVEVFKEFFVNVRKIYPNQPIFVFTPWGWFSETSVSYYYPGDYEGIVNYRHSLGDNNVHLVNTTGWIGWDDVYSDNGHPNPQGHQKIAGRFQDWLEKWGLSPEKSWATAVL
ncbi:hypothetical protein FIBSPDRAFT_1049505 [Athelia psychrophila]|uniref:SGNH hydrolase-type esterase domain-containing protein n=1 Tax=Athelia psychrophila TaxID=1759441 RepID=A0A166C3X8_9AGAM|nr:hypothetical protein FIBSPDRAFT_1049505 [Fibularhizoctonia sp. CBS 109695]